jgi:large subunit ribosomal protein L2
MSVKLVKHKPTSPGVRHWISLDKKHLVKNDKIFKNLRSGNQHYQMGRSSITGHITSWHRGGGAKTLHRDVSVGNINRMGIVVGITYDPNRTAFVATSFDLEKREFYSTLSNENVPVGTVMKQSCQNKPDDVRDKLYNVSRSVMLGYRTQLQHMPIGSVINAISITPEGKAKYVRAAGTRAQLIRLDHTNASIKLPSGQLLTIPKENCATIGATSNELQSLIVYGKAGRKRNLGRRPIVRGLAMNAVDHPHGGQTNGGRPSVSPWGILTKCGFSLRRKPRRQYAAVKVDTSGNEEAKTTTKK